MEVTIEALTPIQERYAEIRKSDELKKVLKEGAEKANAIATPVLRRVKKKFGLGVKK